MFINKIKRPLKASYDPCDHLYSLNVIYIPFRDAPLYILFLGRSPKGSGCRKWSQQTVSTLWASIPNVKPPQTPEGLVKKEKKSPTDVGFFRPFAYPARLIIATQSRLRLAPLRFGLRTLVALIMLPR